MVKKNMESYIISNEFDDDAPAFSANPLGPEATDKMKQGLIKLNIHDLTDYAWKGFKDEQLACGLEEFQIQNGLKVDGYANPGGPTETAMDFALEELKKPGDPARASRISVGLERNVVTNNRQKVDNLMHRDEFGMLPHYMAGPGTARTKARYRPPI